MLIFLNGFRKLIILQQRLDKVQKLVLVYIGVKTKSDNSKYLNEKELNKFIKKLLKIDDKEKLSAVVTSAINTLLDRKLVERKGFYISLSEDGLENAREIVNAVRTKYNDINWENIVSYVSSDTQVKYEKTKSVKSTKDLKKLKYFRDINVPSTKIRFTGNRHLITLSNSFLKENNLNIGQRVRPILLVLKSSLESDTKKSSHFREVYLPITEIKKYGNAASITIIRPIAKRWKLDVDQIVHPILIVKETLNVSDFPDDEFILIKHGVVSTIKKRDWIAFMAWNDAEKQNIKNMLSKNGVL
jgi:antitoxin component of MazEF toxin-antitoxin module